MLTIDRYSYTNKLRKVNPLEKAILSLVTLILCLIFSSLKLYFFVIFSMSIIILALAKIPIKTYIKTMLIPFPFLLLSVLTIIINITKDPEFIDYGFRVYSLYFGVTTNGLTEGAYVFLRSLAAISCLYFLVLTTPMVDIVWILKKIRMPAIFTEILTIVYRFIFVLIETALEIRLSQQCRLGYSGFKRSIYSLAKLITNLFIKAYQSHKMLYISLVSRGYTGELNVIERKYNVSYRNITYMTIYLCIVLIIGVFK